MLHHYKRSCEKLIHEGFQTHLFGLATFVTELTLKLSVTFTVDIVCCAIISL